VIERWAKPLSSKSLYSQTKTERKGRLLLVMVTNKLLQTSDSKQIDLRIFDTYAGDSDTNLPKFITRNVSAAFILVDARDTDWVETIEKWLKVLHQHEEESEITQKSFIGEFKPAPFYIIANKVDEFAFQQQIDEAYNEVKSVAKEVGAEDGFIVSSKENCTPVDFTSTFAFISNIEEIFKICIEKLNSDGLLVQGSVTVSSEPKITLL